MSVRWRIFFSMVALMLGAFLLTGLITLVHFRNKNEEYHLERLRRKEYAVISSIDFFLGSAEAYSSADSLVQLFDTKVCELAEIHELPINIYSLEGGLLISSHPELVDEGRVDRLLPEQAAMRLRQGENSVVLASRQSDSVNTMFTFDYLRDGNGNPLGVLSLPYFTPKSAHIDELRAFMRSLAEIYSLLFLGAVLLAFVLSNRISLSLRELGNRMRQMRLDGQNKPLPAGGRDEVGRLVEEYNRMLGSLEKSAVQLARSERDHAWKEMARQVAHEIKNPLTPMRLQVQMLERQSEQLDRERIKTFSESIIEQIDALGEIAEAFARFASMPELKIERFNLIDIVHRSAELYRSSGLVWRTALLEAEIMGDRAQLLRVMNNLLKNAFQSVKPGDKPLIEVEVTTRENEVCVRVGDNGEGIPESMSERVFEPRFTTKSGGMGLGLAMARSLVESMGGRIWFKPSARQGTDFFLCLPLADADTPPWKTPSSSKPDKAPQAS